MISRSFFLYLLSLKIVVHRLRYNLARELVVAACGSVLLAVFSYIFNDFLNEKVHAISPAMRHALASAAGNGVLLLATLFTAGVLARLFAAPNSLALACQRLGEKPKAVGLLKCLQVTTTTLLVYGLAWVVIERWLVKWSLPSACLRQTVALFFLPPLVALFKPRPRHGNHREALSRALLGSRRKNSAMIIWRLTQMVSRGRLAPFLATASLASLTLLFWLGQKDSPFFVTFLLAFIAGFFTAIAIPFQMQQDLRHAWAERSMGVSHNDVMKVYLTIGCALASLSGLAALLTYTLSQPTPVAANNWQPSIQIFAAGALASLIMPGFLLQIDARRPAIAIMICFLLGLFLATAVLAHWLSIVLLPLTCYFAMDYQKNLYYRA